MKKMVLWALVCVMFLSACAKPAEPQPEQPQPAPIPETMEEERPQPETVPEPEENLFRFTRKNLPKLDGSTSMVPLGQAVLAALLGERQTAVEDLVEFHRTTESFRYLMRGESDLLLVAEPNQIVFDEMAQQGFAYEMEPIAKEALVFIVNSDNPIQSLTVEQLQGIYTGQITNWLQIGGEDVDIVPFQRNSTSGSQVLMDKLVMGDLEMMAAPQEWIPSEMDTLMQGVRGYEDSASAIGYSVYYYAEDMRMAEGMRILPIEGVEPTDATIADGSYPLVNYYFAVIGKEQEKDSPARILFDWLRSIDGQTLLESQGYVPVGASAGEMAVYLDASGLSGFDQPMEICSRRTEAFVDMLIPGDYGLLRPYVGSRAAFDMTIYGNSGIYNGYMGLIDDSGAIVVDPVYTEVNYLYDQMSGSVAPFYLLSKELWKDSDWGGYMGRLYGFCSLDGSVSEPCVYEQVVCSNGMIVAVENAESGLFRVFGADGKILLDSADWPQRVPMYLSAGEGTVSVTRSLVGYTACPDDEQMRLKFYLFDWHGDLIDDGYDWVDLSGDGPYTYSCWTTNEHGYLDTYGRKTLEQNYKILNGFRHGQALVKYDGVCRVIDSKGQILWEPDREEISACSTDTDVMYLCQPEGKQKGALYNSAFEPLFSDADRVISLGDGVFLLWKGRTCMVSDGKHFSALGELDPGQNYYSYNGGAKDRILIQCYLQQEREYWLLDRNFDLLSSGRLQDEGVELLADRLAGDSVAVCHSTVGNYYPYTFTVLEYPGAPKLENVNILGIYSGWYMVEDEFSSGYMDADGNWLFRVSLMTDMTD